MSKTPKYDFMLDIAAVAEASTSPEEILEIWG
jgi:hypothetical protein